MASDEIKLKHKVQLKKKVSEEVTSSSSPSPVNEPKRSFPKWIWACLCAVLLVVCCVIFFLKQKGPQTVAPVTQETSTETVADNPTESNNDTLAEQSVSETTETENSQDEPEQYNLTDTDSSEPTSGQENGTTQTVPSGDIETEAKNVIRGVYGNGQTRKDNLRERYAEIQSKVNEMYRNGLVK